MGASLTIDKHTTALEDWLYVENRLDSIPFDGQISNHVGVWRVPVDDISAQEAAFTPIDLSITHSPFSPFEVYVGYAIKTATSSDREASPFMLAILSEMRLHLEEVSYRASLVVQRIDGNEFATYAWFGKQSKVKPRMLAVSYAYKLQRILDSKKKLAIISGGGVLRNKKLQKGSTLFLSSCSLSSRVDDVDLADFGDMHIVSLFTRNSNQPLLFQLKSRRDSPFVKMANDENTCVNKAEEALQKKGIKPPMLKLTLKPYEQVTYEQIAEEQSKGMIKFDIRATARHELKMQKFQNECNEIIEGVFVSGEKVARSLESLEKNKIAAVINCAGDYCQNWFQGKGIQYLTFFLKDSQNENIECLFYRAIEFIQNTQKNKQNVLVHCIQGVSRSISIVAAFIIFKYGYDYKKTELFIKQKRGIACPNNGFMVELIQFHKRLYEDYSSLPAPRVFMVSSHCKQTPSILTARMIKQPLFDAKKYVGLDSRTVYVIQTVELVYIWVGSKCEEKKLQNYWGYAQQYVKKLQKYERASLRIKAISQGSEGREFFTLWNLKDAPEMYQNTDYTRLFAEGDTAKPGGLRKFYEREPEESVQHKLFISPDFQKGLGVFELEDLNGLCLLVSSEDEKLIVYIWRDDAGGHEENDQFLDNVLKLHYSNFDSSQIIIVEESSEAPSEQFLACFT